MRPETVYDEQGNKVREWNDWERTVKEFHPDGTVKSLRAYTPEERAGADAALMYETGLVTKRKIQEDLEKQVKDLELVLEQLEKIEAAPPYLFGNNPARYVQELAGLTKQIVHATIQTSRIASNSLTDR